MVASIHVPNIGDIRWHRSAVPATASQQKAILRGCGSGAKKKLLDPCLPIRHTVSQKAEIARKSRLGGDRVVSRGVEGIVDRHACPRSEGLIGLDDGFAAAIGEDEVIAWDERPEGVVRSLQDSIQRR